jgi:dTDP-4-amino-4,6-dideoxygalactose transaminase
VTSRHQLPVSSPIALRALAGGALAALRGDTSHHEALASLLARRFGARAAALTDSGTSALVLALRLAVGEGGTVAFPAYACIDLAAAALRAGVRVRLYDVDPHTLSADLDSAARALDRGARALLAVHLYGHPTDVPALAALAAGRGATVIEDAAQGAGGTLGSVPLGGFGPLTVLSFGRGKGTTGGGGGALLAIGGEWEARVREAAARLGPASAGWRELAGAAAQWSLGRPAIYGIPASIPALRLGEMVYHAAGEPAPLARAAARLTCGAYAALDADVATRRSHARALRDAARGTAVHIVEPLAGGESGWLRAPALVRQAAPVSPRLGVLRAYPRTLFEMEELRPALEADEGEHPGALLLRERLVTLPTHALLRPPDIEAITAWMYSL